MLIPQIQAFEWRPHLSIEEMLALFLTGQGRSILDATRIDVQLTGAYADELSRRMERDLARQLDTTLDAMRRFLVRFADGLGYQGYLELLSEGSWTIRVIEIVYYINAPTTGQSALTLSSDTMKGGKSYGNIARLPDGQSIDNRYRRWATKRKRSV